MKTISLTSDDMRNFSLQGYGMNISLAAVMPVKFSLSFQQSRRAASEPAAPQASTQTTPEVEVLASADVETYADEEPQQVRPPSPAPTEIDDPEPEALLQTLQTLNIKVRDFAYPAPPASPFSSPSPAPKATIHTPPTPATEIFDQYKGIAEFEFRLVQDPRTYPITGKTLRRLLDMGWVSMGEAKARLHQMDCEAMKEYDARDSRHAWRPCRWTSVPDTDMRQRLLLDYGGTFVHLDKMRRIEQAMNEREVEERRLIEEAEERVRIMEAEREGGMGMVVGAESDDEDEDEDEQGRVAKSAVAAGKKRALEHTLSTPSFANSEALAGPKRAKLSGAPAPPPSPPSTSQPATSKPTPTPTPIPPPARMPPPRQYPAPLSTYNPQLYPEAARVIEAEDRPRPPLPPPREDTPPLEDDEDERDRPGHPLQRKKKRGLKRTLSRTQTFTQL
ncbi:hypothetical protein LshimejAT787_1201710 [Lyophyllum shimeji]|uniref:Uncharacterized protein n=1 Tax=Lyophyllum shimeji TaxID=47721 RepID=A0A9P3PWU5_LYOSH|nr:hypothetical protein LshimejAT787_1201710 [Lyophyllum shimeji]